MCRDSVYRQVFWFGNMQQSCRTYGTGRIQIPGAIILLEFPRIRALESTARQAAVIEFICAVV